MLENGMPVTLASANQVCVIVIVVPREGISDQEGVVGVILTALIADSISA